MFTSQSIYEITGAFDHHAIRQKRLPGGLGMGELETSALTTMVLDFAGVDAFGHIVTAIGDKLEAAFFHEVELESYREGTAVVYVNGIAFKLGLSKHFGEGFGDEEEWICECVRNTRLPCPTLNNVFVNCVLFQDEDLLKVVARMYTHMMHNAGCNVCGVLIDASDIYCQGCCKYWNETGCITCLGKVGKLEDGEHQACKRRRLE